jgi:hypothetical protein
LGSDTISIVLEHVWKKSTDEWDIFRTIQTLVVACKNFSEFISSDAKIYHVLAKYIYDANYSKTTIRDIDFFKYMNQSGKKIFVLDYLYRHPRCPKCKKKIVTKHNQLTSLNDVIKIKICYTCHYKMENQEQKKVKQQINKEGKNCNFVYVSQNTIKFFDEKFGTSYEIFFNFPTDYLIFKSNGSGRNQYVLLWSLKKVQTLYEGNEIPTESSVYNDIEQKKKFVNYFKFSDKIEENFKKQIEMI